MDVVGVILVIVGSLAALVMAPRGPRPISRAGVSDVQNTDEWYEAATAERSSLVPQFGTRALVACGVVVALGVVLIVA